MPNARKVKAAARKAATAKGRAPRKSTARKTTAPRKATRAARPMTFTLPGGSNVKPPRAGSKRARVLEMLQSKTGATHAEVMSKIGWDRVTAYEGIRLLSIHNGYALQQDSNGRIRATAPAVKAKGRARKAKATA